MVDALPSCRLDAWGRREQGERYRRLARHVVEVRRAPERLELSFDERVDPALLAQAVAVERDCCPFLSIASDDRSLRFALHGEDHRPVLDTLAAALGA